MPFGVGEQMKNILTIIFHRSRWEWFQIKHCKPNRGTFEIVGIKILIPAVNKRTSSKQAVDEDFVVPYLEQRLIQSSNIFLVHGEY